MGRPSGRRHLQSSLQAGNVVCDSTPPVISLGVGGRTAAAATVAAAVVPTGLAPSGSFCNKVGTCPSFYYGISCTGLVSARQFSLVMGESRSVR